MEYKFFTNNIVTKFINALVYNSLLPYVKTIRPNSYIVNGKTYIYKDKLIRCTRTGIFIPNFNDSITSLKCSSNLKVTNSGLVVTSNLNNSSYEIIGNYDIGMLSEGLRNRYIPKTSYYDSNLHENLGSYLRALRDIHGIDLMPFYNCFSYRVIEDIKLTPGGYEIGKEEGYKVVAIPIKFNQEYTIAIDCDTDVIMQSVFYNKFGLVRTELFGDIEYLTDIIKERPTHYKCLKFKEPVIYKVSDTDLSEDSARACEEYESELMLLIRLPDLNDSTITVLEGNYTLPPTKINPSEIPSDILDISIDKYNCYTSELSLLQVNDHCIYPFSDRLVEYLLLNVIDSQETIDDNIGYVQNILYGKSRVNNVWEDTIKYDAFNTYMNAGLYGNNKKVNKLDITGYVDKDMEKFLTNSYSTGLKTNADWVKGG